MPSTIGLVLTHGAGANANAPLLVTLDSQLSAAGVTVQRYTLPYRVERPTGPPRPADGARDRAGLKAAVAEMRSRVSGPVFLGGHSYGGRQATMLAAEESGVADGLVLLSYPLHPPRRPADLRTAHLPNLRTRALFIHGSRDPFGTLEEMSAALALIPVPAELVPIQGAGHDLKAKDAIPTILEAFHAFAARM